ncbi:GumC family protein [Marimonas sp. MJW-29]|uniref:GumC family protein n=1 Tax=Sulfitobacter sediminis TaxID=3234186 RepID=A0ABV3RNW8_9RHOB
MNFDLVFYRALVLRRLPVMILFVLLFSGLGLVTALNLPDTFSTSARLLHEAPQIPSSMIPTTVQTGAEEQLAVIEQRLLTRANLIDIANRFDVFENIREMEPDRVYERMREATTIRRRSGGRSGATMMTIEFKGRAPRIVANVVNEYVTLVLDENARFRVSRAENTLDFFQQEVDRLDEELTRQTVEITRFKTENADALPQDRNFRLQRASLLQERRERLARELALARQQRGNIEARFAVSRRPSVTPSSATEQELLVIKAELDRLTETYSESNPRVIRLKDRIEQLEAIVAAQTSERDQIAGVEVGAEEQILLELAIEEADNRIDALQSQIDETAAELEELQTSISQSTANSFQLAELERDLAITQSRYDNAVANLNSARMSERIEATAQGERISVVENASVPQIPSGPNRLAIAAVGIISGIGLAVGYFVLLEFMNRSIRRPSELVDRYNVVPIVTIPYMESPFARLIRRSALIMATLAVLVGVPLALWYVDSYYQPLELIVQRGLSKLGLG